MPDDTPIDVHLQCHMPLALLREFLGVLPLWEQLGLAPTLALAAPVEVVPELTTFVATLAPQLRHTTVTVLPAQPRSPHAA